jgi:hypothetical protein
MNKKMQEAQARHEVWLLSVGVKGRTELKGVEHVNLRQGITSTVPLGNNIAGNGSKKDANVYTGDYIKGIATMHKSNAVPIFSDEEAKAISTMRRN